MTVRSPMDDCSDSLPAARIWAIAAVTAFVGTVPVLLLKDNYPWVILIPIGIGLVLIVAVQLAADFWPSVTKLFYGSFSGPASGVPEHLSDFKSTITFALQIDPASEPKGQRHFGFFDSPLAVTRKPQRVQLESGEYMYVVGAERFVELLVDRLLKDSDKIVEHSLTMAASRYGSEKVPKVILETIQADFRGNWITVVSRDGELVLSKLAKALNEAEEEKQSPLSSLSPRKERVA